MVEFQSPTHPPLVAPHPSPIPPATQQCIQCRRRTSLPLRKHEPQDMPFLTFPGLDECAYIVQLVQSLRNDSLTNTHVEVLEALGAFVFSRQQVQLSELCELSMVTRLPTSCIEIDHPHTPSNKKVARKHSHQIQHQKIAIALHPDRHKTTTDRAEMLCAITQAHQSHQPPRLAHLPLLLFRTTFGVLPATAGIRRSIMGHLGEPRLALHPTSIASNAVQSATPTPRAPSALIKRILSQQHDARIIVDRTYGVAAAQHTRSSLIEPSMLRTMKIALTQTYCAIPSCR
ncbi:hypothetical protein BD410DRAFT_810706 [Rickenella mellea]|uniref:Uncharacterized protein n=1 Tax=Rickenella mellea TaxID=50990 RepID=A0A4Y7PDC0_9AGAM|nr:hypothetical protein BD410DRAFT_810706 [Rickenella mellea]